MPDVRRFLAAAAVLTAFVAAPAETAAQQDDATELEPMIVTPPYLYDSDRQLVRIGRHLPDLGEPGNGLLAQLSSFFEKRRDPNALPPLEQEMLLRTLGELDRP